MSDIKSYKTKANSVSSSQILPCNYNFNDALIVFNEMVQNGCYELFKHKKVTKHISIIIGYGDSKKEFVKGSVTMHETTNLFYIISDYINKLFNEIVDKTRQIRKMGYNFYNIIDEINEQYDLFTDLKEIEKQKNVVQSVVSLQDKYGKNAVLKGIDLLENATQKERNETIGGHKSG